MSSDIDLGEIRRVLRHELVAIRGQWAWLLALGIVLVVVGTIAIGMPLLTTLATASPSVFYCYWGVLPSSWVLSGRATGAAFS